MTLPEPFEGIVGTSRIDDPLLSLDDAFEPFRYAIMRLATNMLDSHLQYGDPWFNRLSRPEIGDLVIETSRGGGTIRRDPEHRAFGYLIARREEWAETHAERAAHLEQNPDDDTERWRDTGWYIQYGPDPTDVCRWTNCRFASVVIDYRAWNRMKP